MIIFDATLFYYHEYMSVLYHTANSEIKEVSNCLKTNLMYLGTCMQTKKMAENNNHDIYRDSCKLNEYMTPNFLEILLMKI